MVISYDQEARSRQAFIDEARKNEEAEKKQVAKKMKELAAERDAYKKSDDESSKHLQRIGLEKIKAEERVAELEKQLSALSEKRERDIEAAASSARRTAAAEVQIKLDRANELFGQLMRRPIRKMVHLAQADSNLQLLDDMESTEETFDPKAERALLVEHKASLEKADEIFDAMVADLKKILGTNYVVPINVADIIVSPRVEVSAKSVGIHVASGSNDGSLGMRLRDASEELSESESDGADEIADPVPAGLIETHHEPAPLDQDSKTGEAASSAGIVAPAENQGVEEGELVAEEKGAEDGELVA